MKIPDFDFIPAPKVPRLNREIIVTEKIDGTRGTVYVSETGEVFAGSRSRWVTPENDNYSFAAWVEKNSEELRKLGPGRHDGEWWGAGIQRRYGQAEKHFSLFNVGRWFTDKTVPGVIEKKEIRLNGQPNVTTIGPGPACCGVVPILYCGPFNPLKIVQIVDMLRYEGSVAAPGFPDPEGIVVFHTAAQQCFKVTLDHDESPKGQVAK